MESILRNLRFGVRILLRSPAITVSIVLILALGIGLNSTMFCIADALLIHAIRYPDPQALSLVWSIDAEGTAHDVSPADFMDWRARSRSFSDLAAWMPTSFVVLGGERPRQIGGAKVTANFFRALQVRPVLGRTFLPDEDGLDNPSNAAHSAVISFRFWQEDLGADPNVLGRAIQVDAVSYNVIGVAPPGFQFWWRAHDIWVPVTFNVHERDYRNLVVVGRGNSPRNNATAEMVVIANSLSQAYPKSDKGWTARVDDLQDWLLNGTFRSRFLLLCWAVGIVLLIVCTNVASLLLARSAAREKEIAVRLSLGASRGRVLGQLLTESTLLALSGGALGLAIAWGLIRLAPKIVPPNAIPGGPIEMNAYVICFTAAVSLVACVLFGLMPAITASRSDVQSILKDSTRGSTGGKARSRFRQTMVAAEVAAALMLIVSTWLMVDSLRGLTRIDPGFDPRNVLTLRLVLPGAKYDPIRALAFCQRAVERLSSIPGVKSVASGMGSGLPFPNTAQTTSFELEGMPPKQDGEIPSALYSAVSVDYFRTLAIRLERGRVFTDLDNEHAPVVVNISATLAARYFPNQDPLGKHLWISRPLRSQGVERVRAEIVGVMREVKLTDLAREAAPTIYAPITQNPYGRTVWFAVRTDGDPRLFASAVRQEFSAIDSEQPVEQVGTLAQLMDGQLTQPRFQTGLMTSFALVALILAAIGIYGVSVYAVEQRRNEIGIKMALGATRFHVLSDILIQSMRPTAIGIVVGGAAATFVAYGFKSILVDSGAIDPIAFLGAALLLATVALAACYFPARKATRIDPAIALRSE
ncbi:MAG TPA: ABC transporter permease [Bryobacteraceae bacterium]|nr:ABC transporter permease [Bryobacteraceae bacterium]